MVRNNTEIVKELYGFFNTHDVDSIISLLDPEVEWGEPDNPHNPASGFRHGHEGFLEWYEIGRRTEEILSLQPKRMLVDHDSVAVVGSLKCRAIKTSKIYESDFVHLLTFKEGKVTRFQEFFDTYAAGEAFRE